QEQLVSYDFVTYSAMRTHARTYNQALKNGDRTESDYAYNDCLNLDNGIMGYIEISKIDLSLPIYHGSSESVLQKGIGHLEWSTLPTGDLGNHTVLTGHTGLPSAKLFTNLDQVVVGDSFSVTVLDQEYLYEVEELLVVEPHEVDALARDPEKDLVTLVTCTPYGVNSHRLLVQGILVDTIQLSFDFSDEEWYTAPGKTFLRIFLEFLMLCAVLLVAFVLNAHRFKPAPRPIYRVKYDRELDQDLYTNEEEFDNLPPPIDWRKCDKDLDRDLFEGKDNFREPLEDYQDLLKPSQFDLSKYDRILDRDLFEEQGYFPNAVHNDLSKYDRILDRDLFEDNKKEG
ncbi:MAG: class C sortase, partial [Eubacteriales bacterium]